MINILKNLWNLGQLCYISWKLIKFLCLYMISVWSLRHVWSNLYILFRKPGVCINIQVYFDVTNLWNLRSFIYFFQNLLCTWWLLDLEKSRWQKTKMENNLKCLLEVKCNIDMKWLKTFPFATHLFALLLVMNVLQWVSYCFDAFSDDCIYVESCFFREGLWVFIKSQPLGLLILLMYGSLSRKDFYRKYANV